MSCSAGEKNHKTRQEDKNDNSSEEDYNRNEVKEEKKLKACKVKEENAASKRLCDVSPPKRRRILHKMMTRYRNDPFYTRLDIAKKILKRLKVNQTSYFISRIKQDMANWDNENITDSSDSEEDEPENSANKPKPLQVAQKKERDTVEDEARVEATVANEPKAKVDPLPDQKIPKITATVEGPAKKVEVIDLTIEIKKEIKKEVEYITVEDDPPTKSESEIYTPAGALPYVPYPVIGYNAPYYPQGFYHPGNFTMYNPYMHNQFPYHPYSFYSAPSDILPNYPIDGGHGVRCTDDASQPDFKNNPEAEAAGTSKDPAK